MSLVAGIDIGSTTTELIVLNENKEITYSGQILTAGNIKAACDKIKKAMVQALNIDFEQLSKVVATGYGRKYADFAGKNVTEISCYAKGAAFLHPQVRTVIDIGGQDSKIIALTDNGGVQDFVMNDKCAAGTGKFLEMIAHVFDVEIGKLGEISTKADKVVSISSICAVFAESEVVSLISQGENVENIINSIHHSIGEKIRGMANRLSVREEIMFCGGVAHNSGMAATLQQMFAVDKLYIPENVQAVGALGAALLAMES